MSAVACRTCHRRDFIRGSIGLALAAQGSLLAGCASLLTRTVAPVNDTLRLALSQYPDLARRDGALRVRAAGSADPIFVFAQDNRQYVALSSVCTHLGCTVDLQGARLVCPCHGSNYDREGRVLQGPAEQPLQRFRTEVTSDGTLVIHLRAGDRP